MVELEKVIKDGKVAILFSPGLGSGWWTWNKDHDQLIYEPAVVKWVLGGKPVALRGALELMLTEKYEYVYIGSNLSDLEVTWLPLGTPFKITEYDGNESLAFHSDEDWHVA
jgi:hypothetical protein